MKSELPPYSEYSRKDLKTLAKQHRNNIKKYKKNAQGFETAILHLVYASRSARRHQKQIKRNLKKIEKVLKNKDVNPE